ncbi:PucR family transcriptional regulator ligand-binding domain-containing protein [Microbacterium sp. NPDC058345]|uniref:PucR family transcriptional regulator ligand-binding domain-containing protein n=1 Tax=Microbacterium sp. NPDC058345 TaxID=3346455 RepID=UPI00364FF1D3
MLDVEPLRRGVPEVLVGGAALDAAVRWVHVSDSDRVAALLDGGELVLTTAAGWPGSAEALGALAASLAAVGAAGVVLELGTRFAVAPPAFVAACRRRGLALIVLESEVKFVAVTEAVHRRIIAGQLDALQERQRLHELYTGLSLRGAAVEVVVQETARALRAPVVLEDLTHELVVGDAFDLTDADAFTGWIDRSVRRPEGWTRVPVAARGIHWGELVALPGPPHPAGRATVLEQAATTLALSRLAEPSDVWTRLRGDLLLGALLGERFVTEADIQARLQAAGFPVHRRALHAVAAGPGTPPADAWLPEALTDRLAVHGGRCLSAVVGAERLMLVSLPRGHRLPDAALSGLGALAVSDAADSVEELRAALTLVRRLARTTSAGELLRVAERPLARLAAELGGDHRLREHSTRLLAPLIRHDEATGGDLIRVLRAVVAHPGSRTAAAGASHLSRSVFYQRLALISELTGADLDDGETLAALHLAVLAHRD